MVMQHHKPECRAEKLVLCVQCQGHSEGLYNQNMTIFYYIFKSAGPFATKVSLMVQHHKPECPVGKCDYCVQGQGHNKVKNVSECLSRQYLLNHRTFCHQTWHGYAAS